MGNRIIALDTLKMANLLVQAIKKMEKELNEKFPEGPIPDTFLNTCFFNVTLNLKTMLDEKLAKIERME